LNFPWDVSTVVRCFDFDASRYSLLRTKVARLAKVATVYDALHRFSLAKDGHTCCPLDRHFSHSNISAEVREEASGVCEGRGSGTHCSCPG